MSHNQVHQNIRAWRHHRQLTVDQVARMIGADIRSIEMWETEGATIPVQALEDLATAFKIDPGSLFVSPCEYSACRPQLVLDSLKVLELRKWAINRAIAHHGFKPDLKADIFGPAAMIERFVLGGDVSATQHAGHNESIVPTHLVQNVVQDSFQCPSDRPSLQQSGLASRHVSGGQSGGGIDASGLNLDRQIITLHITVSPVGGVVAANMEKTGVPGNGTPVTGQEPAQ